jgi:membrane-associated phospholipid phosphatase
MSLLPEAPPFAPLDAPCARLSEVLPFARLPEVVPFERFRPVRMTLMCAYLLGYVWWLRTHGLPIDRISVAISVGAFLVCAFVGKTWRTWLVLLVDCLAYCLMWLIFERTRGSADRGVVILGVHLPKFPLQVTSMRNIDRAMFFGHDPGRVLQQHFWEPSVRWYDVVASATYMTHFVLPVLVLAILWATSHRQWVRFMKRFATLIFVACVMFVVLPTAPPWMVGDRHYPYQLFPQMHHYTWRGIYHIGFKGFSKSYTTMLGDGNPVAAMPSLHASFALIVPAFFLPWIKPKWLKALVLLFPVLMLTSLVYLGEHWVIDGLAGWAVTGGSFWFWNRMEARARRTRAQQARDAIGLVDEPDAAAIPDVAALA